MKKIIVLSLMIIFSLKSIAQLHDITISYSMASRKDFISAAELLTLSQLTHLSTYNLSDSKSRKGGGYILDLNLGFDVFKKNNSLKKLNAIYNLGFQMNYGTNYDTYSDEKTTNSHSEYLSDWGQNIFVDSLVTTTESVIYLYSEKSISNGLTFTLFKEKRFSLNYGANFQLGFYRAGNTINHVDVDSSRLETFVVNNKEYQINKIYYDLEGDQFSTTIEKKLNLFMGLAIPFGVDFRIGNKKEFWKRAHLKFSYTPTFKYTYFKNLSSFKFALVNTFSFISFRYQFKTKENAK